MKGKCYAQPPVMVHIGHTSTLSVRPEVDSNDEGCSIFNQQHATPGLKCGNCAYFKQEDEETPRPQGPPNEQVRKNGDMR